MEPEKIVAIRKKLGMSQRKFAEFFGIGCSTLSTWEKGKYSPNVAHWKKLEKLALENGV